MRYVFLPPYSPQYNPIELAFSSMKAWFRKHRSIVDVCWDDEYMANRLLNAVAYSASSDKARGWFLKCRYIEEDYVYNKH
jgi:transposase